MSRSPSPLGELAPAPPPETGTTVMFEAGPPAGVGSVYWLMKSGQLLALKPSKFEMPTVRPAPVRPSSKIGCAL